MANDNGYPPWREVVSTRIVPEARRVADMRIDTLECGHEFRPPNGVQPARIRACKACLALEQERSRTGEQERSRTGEQERSRTGEQERVEQESGGLNHREGREERKGIGPQMNADARGC